MGPKFRLGDLVWICGWRHEVWEVEDFRRGGFYGPTPAPPPAEMSYRIRRADGVVQFVWESRLEAVPVLVLLALQAD